MLGFIIKHEACSSLVRGKNKFFFGKVSDDTLIYPYLDVTGTATIGFGNTFYHNLEKVKITDNPITYKEASELLENVVKAIESYVNKNVTFEITENQKTSIVSLIYNIGRRKKVVEYLNENHNNFIKMESFFMKYVYSKGIKLKGLENRRKDEFNLFITN